MGGVKLMRKYNSLDLLKILLSVLVVCIHTFPLQSYSRIVNAFLVNELSRIAVPLFFIISGFFYSKNPGGGILRKYFLYTLSGVYCMAF